MPEFCHLHCHTQYSLLDGAARIKSLMKRADELAIPALAITDHGNLYGVPEFYFAAKDKGIQPIIGCEFYITQSGMHNKTDKKRYHQLLLAKNEEGYKNLIKLSSLSYTEGYYYKPRIDRETLKKYSKGLIATTCCLASEVQQTILKKGEEEARKVFEDYLSIFGEDYYIELQNHNIPEQQQVNEVLLRWSKAYNVKCILTNDVHYVRQEDAEAHDVMLCLQTGKEYNDPNRMRFSNDQFYLKSADEMRLAFPDLSAKLVDEALDTTREIADKSKFDLSTGKLLMPHYPLPPEFNNDMNAYLRHLTFEKAKIRYPELTQEIVERLDFELKTVESMGFAGYFLIVQDFTTAARDLGVRVGPGRGCLTGDTPVVMADGTTKVLQNLQIGDKVFTEDGSLQKITHTFLYDIEEPLLKIQCYYGDQVGIQLTKDHKVFAEKQVRQPEYAGWAESTKKSRKAPEPQGIPEWTVAEDLQVGDWVFVPTPQIEEHQIQQIDFAVFSNDKDLKHDEQFAYHHVLNPLCNTIQKTKTISRFLTLDEDWYTVFGIFAGDGWLRKNERPEVGFVFNRNDIAQIEFLRRVMTEAGFEFSERIYKQTIQIGVKNKHLYQLFKWLFNRYECTSATKHVPALVINAPKPFVAAFLKGYDWADGHDSIHKTRFTTTSKTLADQVRFLCWRLDIPATLSVDKRVGDIREAFKNRKTAYMVTIPKDIRVAEVKNGKQCFYRKVEGGLLLKIRHIEEIFGVQQVYDIEVQNHHNYLTSSCLVHNSAAGSAVAFCLGITNIDPLPYNLLFERFLNPERVSMPDVDIDFDDRGRGKVIDYVVQKYGRENVCQIITFGTMGAKTAIRDVARVLNIPLSEADRIAKLIPDGPKENLETAREKVAEFDALYQSSDENIRKLMHYSTVLEGSARHSGIHAAGVIIAPGNVSNYVPVSIAKSKGGAEEAITTQFDGKWVETFGLLKMDFLGLKTLTIINDTLAIIQKNHNIDIDIDAVPLDDKKTYELFQKGDTVSIFQFESTGMREWMRKLKPTSIDDLIAMNALYRPGPMDLIPNYIDRKHGREEVEYPHPLLEEVLKPTYGLPIYQEQVMQMAQVMGGYTLGGADLLRRAMGKKKVEEMQKQRAMFLEGATEKGVPEKTANEVFDMMEKFAGYGFNKSHSAAYSVVAYQTAYLKAHYQPEFMAAVMTSEANDIKKLTIVLEEARHLGLNILPPNINTSDVLFTTEGNAVRFGLGAIKGVGALAIESLIKERDKKGKFKSIYDLCARADLRLVNKKVLESLAKAGAFDDFEGRREQFVAGIEDAVKYAQQKQSNEASGMMSLFGEIAGSSATAEPNLPNIPVATRGDILREERELMGFYLSGHPLDDFRPALKAVSTATLGNPDILDNGKDYTFCGIVTTVQKRLAKNGKTLAFVGLEDLEGSVEIMFFSDSFEKFQHLLHPDALLCITGKVETEGRLKVLGREVMTLEAAQDKFIRKINLNIRIDEITEADLDALYDLCDEHRGKQCRLGFTIFHPEAPMPLNLRSRTMNLEVSPELLKGLNRILGSRNVLLGRD